MFVWSEGDGWVNLSNTPDVEELWPTFSPDGRWIAYGTDSRVYVRPFPRAGPAIQVSTTRSGAPLWSPDGKELYYISEEEVPSAVDGGGSTGSTETPRWAMAAPVTRTESGIDIGRSERLFRADGYSSIVPIRSWDIAPDGRFLMSVQASEEAVRSAIDDFFPTRIRLIQNWASKLKEQER
jgi:Tol biopolymer transport system component